MDPKAEGWTLGELAQLVGGRLEGPAHFRVSRPVRADSNDPNGIAFAENQAFADAAAGVGALIVSDEIDAHGRPAIRVTQPRLAFGRLLHFAHRPIPIMEGIHPAAQIDPRAWVDQTASIGPFVVIEKDARVGARAKVHAGAYIGEACVVGEDTIVYPGVVLMQDVRIGDRCILHANCVLGADGFGFVWDGKQRVKVPQVGGVVLGDDVEVGAGTCIDRSTCGETVVGDGTKLDNMVQVAHNVTIGTSVVIAAHTSIAGSVRVGNRVVMGGQTAIADHRSVGDDIMLGGRTGVMQDLTKSGEYFGLPAQDVRESLRQMLAIKELPALLKRVKALEAQVAQMEDKE
ncbi:MAG: UDP-3-O-(3-hydroxymyristoyl)glucosamine N-acyltransferase [Chthonomonas sp.]|nr:UDP-3-O-(3-hydroxymyristoyl)glucosamine N-acyltransferase [Chthonomonas sp.]